MDQEKPRSLFDVFAASQETFEDAKKKAVKRAANAPHFSVLPKTALTLMRILPLAPVQDKDGNFLPLERKGYEYPLRSLMLKIEDPKKMVKGKPAITYVTVCNAKYAFKEIEADLIDTYVNTACELYADDEKLCKKLREGVSPAVSSGILAVACTSSIWTTPGDGIQILQLSYSQYKDLEERKLSLWAKLNKNGKNVPCPISSIDSAYPVEIIRKTENNKPSYSFNIDTLGGHDVLEEEVLQRLLDMPRLPEQIYRYTRYHLEATIAYLTQLDEKFDIEVMNQEAVQKCIDQIKTLLPADDQSHFTLGGKDGDNKGDDSDDLDALWKRLDAIYNAGLDDETAEGQELRTSIMEYIDANKLNVKVNRKMTNEDILREIDDELNAADANPSDDSDDEPATSQTPNPVNDEEDDGEPAMPSDEPEDEPEPAPTSRRRERERE